MGFTSRRGRPSTKTEDIGNLNEKHDYGTKELRSRRMFGLTKEAIDICREKGIINNEQHKVALHFRWLYTLKFGAPNISAYDMEKGRGRETRLEDPNWRSLREAEYSAFIRKLRTMGALRIVMNVAVFNYYPRFITGFASENNAQVLQNKRNCRLLHDGLKALQETKNERKINFNCIRGNKLFQV